MGESVQNKGGNMNYVVAVFMSRTETLSFANFLRRQGFQVVIVQTPKEAGRTCGISVKFRYEDFGKIKPLLSTLRFMSFQGFFLEQNVGGFPKFGRV